MPDVRDFQDLDFGGPAIYRILVQGVLGESWIDRLAGMAISTTERDPKKPVTTLCGEIRDQAELNGVIEVLYNLHLPILKIEKVEDES